MKSFATFFSIIILVTFLTACFSTGRVKAKNEESTVITIADNSNQTICVTKGSSFDHPTFVIWKEDNEGNYISTIYITKAYSSGKYSHEMVNDSLWLNREGPSYQPASLPYWTYKKGLINNTDLVPSIENPLVDAYTGATPTTNFIIKSKNDYSNKEYRILFEVNQFGDWNSFWTNDKYPQSNAYKHSAQPSLIYSVTIDNSKSEYLLEPIGHGDPIGLGGNLFADISTLTTAKQILKEIKVSNH